VLVVGSGSTANGERGALELPRTEVDLLLERIGLEGFRDTCATAPVSFLPCGSELGAAGGG